MKNLLALLLMLKVYGHVPAEENEFAPKFEGVVLHYYTDSMLIRSPNGSLRNVKPDWVTDSEWVEVEP